MNFLPREGIPDVTGAHEWIGWRGGGGGGGVALNSIACHSLYVILKIELFPLEKNVYIPKEVQKTK
jgi:hypothetical protein